MAAPPLWRVSSVAWTPIGAEQTASGYEVAWQNSGADQYTVWNTDSSGNFVSIYRRRVGNQRRAGIAGDQLPPGPERRRRDRRPAPRHRD